MGYIFLGEAGVPGREYVRRRSVHSINLAVVAWDSPLWWEGLHLRDYLRSNPEAAEAYGRAKTRAWEEGARTLLAYRRTKGLTVARRRVFIV